jgi:molybdopterin synthase sulfur carrier subunit
MPVNVLIFGQLTEIAGNSLVLDDITHTDMLIAELNKRYPALADKKYLIAVDKKVISGNTVLNDNNTVALLPPFSGG